MRVSMSSIQESVSLMLVRRMQRDSWLGVGVSAVEKVLGKRQGSPKLEEVRLLSHGKALEMQS